MCLGVRWKQRAPIASIARILGELYDVARCCVWLGSIPVAAVARATLLPALEQFGAIRRLEVQRRGAAAADGLGGGLAKSWALVLYEEGGAARTSMMRAGERLGRPTHNATGGGGPVLETLF